jgi:hypothetical protein
MADLSEELNAPLPPGIAALPDEHKTVLAGALSAERRRQHDALDQAIEAGLGFLPRLLRTAVRKALLG